jgi:hypothetical protein
MTSNKQPGLGDELFGTPMAEASAQPPAAPDLDAMQLYPAIVSSRR